VGFVTFIFSYELSIEQSFYFYFDFLTCTGYTLYNCEALGNLMTDPIVILYLCREIIASLEWQKGKVCTLEKSLKLIGNLKLTYHI